MEDTLRQIKYNEFLASVVGADAELIQQIANWVHTNVWLYGIELGFDTTCGKCGGVSKPTVKKSISELTGIPLVSDVAEPVKIKAKTGGVAKAKKTDETVWIPITDAPIIKLKAYDPTSKKMVKGTKIKYKVGIFSDWTTGIVTGFTKYYVKVKNSDSGVIQVKKYSSVLAVAK